MRPFSSSCALFLATLWIALPALAQDPEPAAPRPKIGLVLSGGGARGTAHLGVLRVLEELKVPVDYISGTSMGAVVGGLYASGMSLEEIEEQLFSLDWSKAFKDSPNHRDLPIRRKQDAQELLVGAALGFKDGGVTIPQGFLQGQTLSTVLAFATMPSAATTDFDELPIPFRAVAADITTGEVVVIDSGSLGQAMRASMSIPVAFAPIEIDGRLLVDGGIANNLPVDVVKEMGADIVIAVDISTPMDGRDDLSSAFRVGSQVMTLLVQSGVNRQLELLTERDVLIRPDLTGISAMSFARTADAVRIGHDAASAERDSLSQLGLPAADYERFRQEHRRPDYDLPVIEFIRFENRSRVDLRTLESRVQTPVGEPIDPELLDADLRRLYGLGSFETISFEIVEESGRVGLKITCVAKSWGPHYLRFGFSVESDAEGGASFNAATRYTMTNLNRLGAEWRSQLQLGTRTVFGTEFYQPLDYSWKYFLAPRLQFREHTYRYWFNGAPVAQFDRKRATLGVDLGRNFGNTLELRLGMEAEHGEIKRDIGLGGGPPSPYDNVGMRAGLYYDSVDQPVFPFRGGLAIASLTAYDESLGGDDSFQRLRWKAYRAVGKDPVGALFGLNGSISNDDAPEYDVTTLGGWLNMSGFGLDALSGRHSLLGRAVGYKRLSAPPDRPFTSSLYAGASLEFGGTWRKQDQIDLDSAILGGSIFLAYDMALGPVVLAFGAAEGGNQAIYFEVGRSL